MANYTVAKEKVGEAWYVRVRNAPILAYPGIAELNDRDYGPFLEADIEDAFTLAVWGEKCKDYATLMSGIDPGEAVPPGRCPITLERAKEVERNGLLLKNKMEREELEKS